MGLFLFGKKKTEKKDELKTKQEELLAEEKNDMIRGIEDLSETTVKEVMIPRIDVDFISLETDVEELLTKISNSGHSRFPVYSGSIDNVVGILYVKDLIKVYAAKEAVDLACVAKNCI